MSFRFRTAREIAIAYRNGRTTPSRVAERALAAISSFDRRDPPMRLFISVDEAAVRREAAASTARFQAGQPLGELDGVPFAVKDEYDAIGHGTTCGTAFLGEEPATRDALAVARLRAAGAVLLGKANMHELGMGPSGINVTHGAARNPYDPMRDTGGSSSGSAAIVASGVAPIALGSDSGGSIRVPGSLCGVAGFKGTFDRFPLEGAVVLTRSLDHGGPLGSTVADVIAAFEVATASSLSLPAAGALRVGVCEAWWAGADASIAEAARRALRSLDALGARVVPIELPHLELALPVGSCTFTVEGAARMERHLDAGAPFSPSVRIAFDLARGVSAVTFVKAQRARALLLRSFEEAFANCDVIATPTTAISAPRYREDALALGEVDEATINRLVHFTFPQNLTGYPAAQVPCGYDAGGMPIGLQIIAPWGKDALALATAAAVEQSVPPRRPAVWVDLLE